MKLNSILLCGMAAIALAACQNASKLSENLAGSWAGAPERLFDSGASSATMIQTFSFYPSDSIKDGGQLTLSALISVTGAIDGAMGIVEPVSLTASGYASARGTWRATAADRVELKIDPTSLTVNVDPDAVIINADMADGGGTAAPSMASLKPQMAASIATQLHHAVAGKFASEQTMTGVSLKDDNSTLRFKIDKESYTLSRQPY